MGTGEAGALAEAVRFAAEEDGERVFTGVVDEVCCGWDEDGARLSVSGRSMAALLLDNEALGCDYQTATLADILRDHVTPYGIQVGRTDRLPRGAGLLRGHGEQRVAGALSFLPVLRRRDAPL